MNETLDISRLPREAMYAGPDGAQINLASRGWDLAEALRDLAQHGYIKQNDSFGFAVGHPMGSKSDRMSFNDWDDPYKFVWFVGGWGPQVNRYIANAVRKMRPLLREGTDTLSMRLHTPERFRDEVESENSDGSFSWGDFPWGGANFTEVNGLSLPCATSALLQVEDHMASQVFGGLVGMDILKTQYVHLRS
jgi:hypothetical protein